MAIADADDRVPWAVIAADASVGGPPTTPGRQVGFLLGEAIAFRTIGIG